jgi:hypothetical protein
MGVVANNPSSTACRCVEGEQSDDEDCKNYHPVFHSIATILITAVIVFYEKEVDFS